MPNDGYYYCLNCHSEITPDYNEHCCFCGSAAVAVSGDYSPEEVETAFDLLNKQQQGIVIVLPCKVGDTVYKIDTLPNADFCCECENFLEAYPGNPADCCESVGECIPEECIRITAITAKLSDIYRWLYLGLFGVSIFPNKEEAEQALKEGAGNG